jgi:hypothetical protein
LVVVVVAVLGGRVTVVLDTVAGTEEWPGATAPDRLEEHAAHPNITTAVATRFHHWAATGTSRRTPTACHAGQFT